MANLGNNINSIGAGDINELLDISDLTYLATPESNVVMSRRQKTQSLNESYIAGEIISFIIETGQDYVSWKDSTLNFTLKIEKANAAAPAGASFGGGSILNLLNRITITTASGDKITTLSKANLWNYYNDKMKHSYEWRTAQGGQLLGYGGVALAASTKWVIPLSSICEFFAIDVLTPNVVSNGLKIDIELETVATAFVDATADPDQIAKYTISTPEIRLDHYTLSGGAMNALNTMSATSGLVLNYAGVVNSPFNKPDTFSKFTNKVSDGLAMVSQAWTVVRDVAVTTLGVDSFKSRDVGATDKYKYRLGSTNMPEEDIVGVADWYNQMQYATSSLKHGKELGIRYPAEFKDNAMAVASIDRYWTAGSGMAINQSTSLSITATVDEAAAIVDTFVVHQIRSVSFLEKTSVFM